jgi:hypothetical protein
MSVFQEMNAWIVDNQALVVSAGLPLFALIVTSWTSYLGHLARISETQLSGRMKLSEYRRSNYDELLRISARLQSVFFEAATLQHSHPGPLGADNRRGIEAIECINWFLLRSQATPDQVKCFSDCTQRCLNRFFVPNAVTNETDNILGALRVICKEILDQEWAQIVQELEGIAL